MSAHVTITTHHGDADQVRHTATADGITYTFTGFTYGTPGTVFVTAPWGSTYITDPDRFGDTLDHDWVRRFFTTQGANHAVTY